MMKKSRKESGDFEKSYYSLSKRVLRNTLIWIFVLGIILLVIALSAYIYSLGKRQVQTAYNLSVSARQILTKVDNPSQYIETVMNIYGGMTEEERKQVGTEEYYRKFDKVKSYSGYLKLMTYLSEFRRSGVADYIYIAVYDPETSAIVYVADTDVNPKTYCPPGHWEKLQARELRRFVNNDGRSIPYDFGDTQEYGYMCTSGAAFDGYTGRGRAYVLADVKADTIARRARWFVLNYSVVMLMIMIILGFVVSRRIRGQIVNPINKIGRAARQYVDDTRNNIKTGNHFASLDIKTNDELETLSWTMRDMEESIALYEENLSKISAEKERISSELTLAHRIQEDMLPNIFPAFPERNDFDIYATNSPAKEVGGDFYDFFLIDDDKLCIVMADVSGKGIPAALFMMVAKSMIQTAVLAGAQPAEALENVNSQICESEHEGMFVTVWLGIIDLKTGVLTATNAGHEYPVIKEPDGDFRLYKDKHSFVVGGIGGMPYKEYQVELKPGSKLFLYTDGVTEATDSNKELFGTDRMMEALNTAKDGDPVKVIETVKEHIDDFVGDAEQFDDTTMLSFEYQGETSEKEITVRTLLDVTRPAEIKEVTEVTALVDAELEKLDCGMKAQAQIDIAIDELFSNIAKYAYSGEKGKARVVMEYIDALNEVRLTFIDTGDPYDPWKQKDPDITLSADERGIGGLGILMVRKSMDRMTYEYKDGENRKTICKIIS